MNKWNRKISVWWIPVILVLGIVLGSLGTRLVYRGNTPSTMEGTETAGAAVQGSGTAVAAEGAAPLESGEFGDSVEPGLPQDNESGEIGTGSDNTIQEWNAEEIYVGGDTVLYGGKYYKAKWWTQNETPGQADVWEDTLEAPLSSVFNGKSGAADGGETTPGQPGGAAGAAQDNPGGVTGAAQDNPGGAAGAALDNPDGSTGGAAPGLAADSAGGTALPEPNSPQNEDFRVIAYYPSWAGGSTYQGTSVSDRVQFDKLTHLVYAFAIPTPEGGLKPLENGKMAKELIRTAHEYGVKVMLAVGGWSYQDTPLEGTFMEATDSRDRREAFASAILEMCVSYGFDGVDLDWEHPRVDGASAGQYEDLVLILEELLHEKGLLFSCAVLSGATADGNVFYDAAAHSDKVLQAVDWINVMAYDGGDGERHSGYEYAVNSGLYWRDTRGVPAEKINLGVPFYSRPGWASYGDILADDPQAYKSDVSQYNGMEVWYNGPDTIRKKTAWAGENLGGMMIWEITQDTVDREKSLLTAIWDEKQKTELTGVR